VSKKHKHHHHRTATSSAVDLRPRIERARQEGRFQQALDLSKQLYKYEATPANLDLLKDIYLRRARQLRTQGQTRDALTVLDVASHLEGASPEWLERLAEEMALCGEVGRTLGLLEQMADSPTRNRLLARAADAAVPCQAAGRAALPQTLQADFDRVLLAFQQVEAAQDEAARETLQGIGLRSPFLEWKLLLRGLQAYWTNDDERAVENWQRLTADRLPARLAAPFRFHIDAAFRTAQPPATQATLQKQIDRLQGSTLLTHLRSLQATLANREKMPAALRQAEALLPALRQEAPQLVPRLAACFYWALLESGPDDVLRYQRVFGAPPDDPHLHRLQAIGYERADELELAHKNWQQYEQEIAADPQRWPGDQGKHARAFIWQHMGQNAASIPEPSKKAKRSLLGGFFDEEPLAPLNPSAEKCFQMSLELAPDLLETHEALVRYHLDAQREGKAEKAARQLLQHFPNHVPTLELLGDLRRKHGDYAAALELIQQAMKGNAVDRRLRRKVSDTHLLLARAHVETSRFDEARQQFQFALDLCNGPDGGMVLGYWAACEFKAGDDARAEELIQQALGRTSAPVGIAYLLLTEVHRLKLPRTLKTRFDGELKSGLATPNAEGAIFLTRILAGLHSGGVKYLGQKGHTQKVLSYINKTRAGDFTEPQLEELCRNLLDLESYPQARRFAELGEGKYPESPVFPYLHALGWLRHKDRRKTTWKVAAMLKKAQSLAQGQPSNERRDRMLEDIEKHLNELNPFGFDMLERLFGMGDMPRIFDMGHVGEEEYDDGW
jgi:tetratricopeptide (TPR) repeat protein